MRTKNELFDSKFNCWSEMHNEKIVKDFIIFSKNIDY